MYLVNKDKTRARSSKHLVCTLYDPRWRSKHTTREQSVQLWGDILWYIQACGSVITVNYPIIMTLAQRHVRYDCPDIWLDFPAMLSWKQLHRHPCISDCCHEFKTFLGSAHFFDHLLQVLDVMSEPP